jgi:hypothetical protein
MDRLLTRVGGLSRGRIECRVRIPPPTRTQGLDKRESLIEVADLDTLLGFKGNYMIFPLKQSNMLTTFMMQDYVSVDEILKLHDPDELGNYSIEELVEFMKCVYEDNPDAFTEEIREEFEKMMIDKLNAPRLEKELVVVPSDSLFIEALPGKHPILEDFKLIHRAVDVKKVEAEVRKLEIENLRYASRIVGKKLEDPDVDKKIIVEGANGTIAVPTGDN